MATVAPQPLFFFSFTLLVAFPLFPTPIIPPLNLINMSTGQAVATALYVTGLPSEIADPVATFSLEDVTTGTTSTSEEITTSTTSTSSTSEATSFSSTQGTTVVFVTNTQTALNSTPTATESTAFITSSSTSDESTTSEGTNSTSAGGLSAGASAGIGVGVALGVLTLAFVGFFLYRRRRKNRGLALGGDNNRTVVAELGTDGQKHELSGQESKRAELDVNEQRQNTHVQELE
ncbi:unnamed protein product [Penicillium glandicola]